MHLVMQSSQAKGQWSFSTKKNTQAVKEIVARFADKNEIKILSLIVVGNHLHFHIRLTTRSSYPPFIRGLSAALAMAITESSRWNKLGIKFWDRRPFTQVVSGNTHLTVKDLVSMNDMEGTESTRQSAHWIIRYPRK